jgi:hypothetical protein
MLKVMGNLSKLFTGILFDLIGMGSYFIPGIGPALDLIWAPVSGWLMTRMYPGKSGKIAAVITFLEEILPGTDIIPSFTLMWLYATFSNQQKQEVRK